MKEKKDYVLGWIPKYSIIPLLSALALNMLVYSGSMVLCKNLYHHDFTTAFDRMVPVIPELYYDRWHWQGAYVSVFNR